jgi:hypothetical protein
MQDNILSGALIMKIHMDALLLLLIVADYTALGRL